MGDSAENIREFKSNAWVSKTAAQRYAKTVNDQISLSEIDLDTQMRLLDSNSKLGKKILDIGCGTGALTLRLADSGFEVTGVDISAQMLGQLARRAKKFNVTLVEADIFSLPFNDSSFDAAVSRWVLPHFSDWSAAAREVSRVLRPGGIFIFDFPSREHVEYAQSRESLLSREKLGYQHSDEGGGIDPYFYYGAETKQSISKTLSENGFSLESRTPYGLFVANSLIFEGLSPRESKLKNIIFSLGIRYSKAVRGILNSIEREITPNIDAKLVHGSFIVARKV
jgi:ubiquinone/menaquinone biosynthesis C-methylase UbiE